MSLRACKYFPQKQQNGLREPDPKADIIYINKELFEFDQIKTYVDLINYVSATRKNMDDKCYLFIDEIQDIEDFEKALRHFFAENTYDIYCTGSNATMLSGELATFLSGRYIEFKVYGLTYAEFLEFHKLEDSVEAFSRFYRYGGLPYLASLPFKVCVSSIKKPVIDMEFVNDGQLLLF
ncbi:hypothetical protein F070042J6_45000 [Bacteroides sp. f07]|uniref:AAA family ATPase n=1 Tax=Bacteroides sp. f07 TaxID=3132704 RepID=UPI0034C1E90C